MPLSIGPMNMKRTFIRSSRYLLDLRCARAKEGAAIGS